MTNSIIEPLHTATIAGKSVPFFNSPVGNTDPDWYFWEEGCEEPEPELPDFPWVGLEDLALCMGLPQGLRRRILRDYAPPSRTVTIVDGSLNEGRPTERKVPCTQTVATANGLVIIAPEVLAQRLLGDMRSDAWIGHDFRRAYEIASRQALDRATAALSPHILRMWLNDACRRHHDDWLAMMPAYRRDSPPPSRLEEKKYRKLQDLPQPADKTQYMSFLEKGWACADTPEKKWALRHYWRMTSWMRSNFAVTYRDVAGISGFIPDIADYVDEVAS